MDFFSTKTFFCCLLKSLGVFVVVLMSLLFCYASRITSEQTM